MNRDFNLIYHCLITWEVGFRRGSEGVNEMIRRNWRRVDWERFDERMMEEMGVGQGNAGEGGEVLELTRLL